MQFHDKIFQLRKNFNMTQSEMAEVLNVSRQAISKWEMGTVIPDVSNMLAISKFFNVSIDYFVNDDFIIDDSQNTKPTPAIAKTQHHYNIKKILIIFCLATIIFIIGILTYSLASVIIFFMIVGFSLLFYYGTRLLMLFFSSRKNE